MNLKKFIIFLFIISLCLIDTTSCNSRKENTIKFLYYFDSTKEKGAIVELFKEFERDFNCSIDLILYDYSRGPDELISMLQNKDKFDVIAFDSEWFGQMKESGILYVLTTGENFKENSFTPALLDYCKFNGKYYCLPWLIDSRFLYINEKITNEFKLDSKPSNLQELLTNVELINESGKYYGISLVGANKQYTLKNLLPFIYSFGGQLVDSNSNSILNHRNNLPGFYYYLKLGNSGIFETKREAENLFMNGKSGYCITDLSLFQKILKSNAEDKYLLVPIPGNNRNKSFYANAVMLGINKQSCKKELSTKLIEYLCSWENSDNYTVELLKYGVPADLNFSCKFIDKNIYSMMIEQIKNPVMAARYMYWYNIETVIESEFEKVIYSEKSIEASLNDAQEEVITQMKKIKKRQE